MEELKLQQKRQKAIDKTKLAMLRNVQTMDYSKKQYSFYSDAGDKQT